MRSSGMELCSAIVCFKYRTQRGLRFDADQKAQLNRIRPRTRRRVMRCAGSLNFAPLPSLILSEFRSSAPAARPDFMVIGGDVPEVSQEHGLAPPHIGTSLSTAGNPGLRRS